MLREREEEAVFNKSAERMSVSSATHCSLRQEFSESSFILGGTRASRGTHGRSSGHLPSLNKFMPREGGAKTELLKSIMHVLVLSPLTSVKQEIPEQNFPENSLSLKSAELVKGAHGKILESSLPPNELA
jgi:hypothetical protein